MSEGMGKGFAYARASRFICTLSEYESAVAAWSNALTKMVSKKELFMAILN